MMPETPDFEKITARLSDDAREGRGYRDNEYEKPIARMTAELRHIWNRGATDLAKLGKAFIDARPTMKVLDQTLKTLDRSCSDASGLRPTRPPRDSLMVSLANS